MWVRSPSPPRRLVTDELWALMEPLVPRPTPGRAPGGRPRLPDRSVLAGILFVLTPGCGRHDLPRELGCGSGNPAWRRLREWQRAGVWERLHQVVPDGLGRQGLLDWSRACLDRASVRAKRGAS